MRLPITPRKDFWIPHRGHECPVHPDVEVRVKVPVGARKVAMPEAMPAREWDWDCAFILYNIAAWSAQRKDG